MAHAHNLLALDLGAESGRGILGTLSEGKITLDVLHRFPNGPTKIGNKLFWDPLRLFGEMKHALAQAAERGPLASLGVDTWGVDFALLGEDGEMLGNPRHYRDPHTESVMSTILGGGGLHAPLSAPSRGGGGTVSPLSPGGRGAGATVSPLSPGGRGAGGEGDAPATPAQSIFNQTGLQFLRFNSLFQLIALQQANSTALQAAKQLLFMPDLFHHWFGGQPVNEATITSTSQCYNPQTNDWAWPLLQHYHLPQHLFGKVVPAGSRLGELHPSIIQELPSKQVVPIVAPASHDTAAAVAAVPAQGNDWCYLSSGTWSLMGVELPKPIINEDVRAANFTNEGGVHRSPLSLPERGVGGIVSPLSPGGRGAGGEGASPTTRFLKNIMGMWLVQECRRSFLRAKHDISYEELVRLAEAETPFRSIINPDDARFMLPLDMPTAIAAYCKETGQPQPESHGQIVRCCLESLALRYRWTKEKLTQLTSQPINVIHIVGGGCQNRLLNQLTADATGCLVLAGPIEATALGNLLTQAMGLGLVKNLNELRNIVRQSFTVERFEPKGTRNGDDAYGRFLGLVG
jgi:rhamnulokinase